MIRPKVETGNKRFGPSQHIDDEEDDEEFNSLTHFAQENEDPTEEPRTPERTRNGASSVPYSPGPTRLLIKEQINIYSTSKNQQLFNRDGSEKSGEDNSTS